MLFDKTEQYILFGGGSLMLWAARQLSDCNYRIFIVTSKRHSKESFLYEGTNSTLVEHIKAGRFEYTVTEDITDDPSVIDRITPGTTGISFGAAWIFKESFIRKFNGRLLNCHGSRLPQDRGGGGFSWRIMRGDRYGTALIHLVDQGVDTGGIIMSEEYIFPPQCKYPAEYQHYSEERYKELLCRFFKLAEEGTRFEIMPQNECFSTYWPRLSTNAQGWIDWNWSVKDTENFICAFDDPYAGASTLLNGRKVRLKKCCAFYGDGTFHPFQSGIIYRIWKNTAFIAQKDGAIAAQVLLNENGDDITASLKVGDRLYTPFEHIESANRARVFYSPEGITE